MAVLALAAVLALGLSACASTVPDHTVKTTRSAIVEQRFASETQALGAARSLYERYLAVSDEISADGGAGVQKMATLVTVDELEIRKEGAEYLKQNDLRIVGPTRLRRFELQKADLKSGEVNAYACLDFSDARIRDGSGKDVTPRTREDLQTLLARFVWQQGRLLLKESGQWSGDSIC